MYRDRTSDEITITIWKRPLCTNATRFSEIKNNAFCHSNISYCSEFRYLANECLQVGYLFLVIDIHAVTSSFTPMDAQEVAPL